jgi:hypothetical protein
MNSAQTAKAGAAPQLMAAIIASLCFIAMPSSAEAVVIKLYYIPTNAGSCCTDTDKVVRVILQAAREFEAHSYGAIQFDWRGISNVLLDGSDNRTLQIWWDPSLVEMNDCGLSYPPGNNFGAATGWTGMNRHIAWRLSTSDPNTGNPVPWLNSECRDFRANVMHEMTHFFRPELGNNHPIDSVLTYNSIWGDLWARNLWNSDIGGINPAYYPKRPVALSMDFLQAGETVSNAGGTVFSGGANHTGAVGPGGPAYQYARVFTDLGTAVWFEQGNGYGSGWSAQRQLGSPWNPTTFHRACIATNTVNFDMMVAWTASTQAQASVVGGGAVWAGTREVVFTESHDGGATWSLPFSIPSPGANTATARTRTGIACAFDLVNSQFVLAYANDIEELKLTWRSTSNGSSWSTPVNMASPFTGTLRTADAPTLSFDPMDWSGNRGVISWWDADTNYPKTMWIHWNSIQGRYTYDSGYLSGVILPGEVQVLRSSLVPSVHANTGHWAFSTQASDVLGRWRRTQPSNVTNADFLQVSGVGYFDWYVGASANRWSFTEKAYLRHIAYF